jgi:hypothetical protein
MNRSYNKRTFNGWKIVTTFIGKVCSNLLLQNVGKMFWKVNVWKTSSWVHREIMVMWTWFTYLRTASRSGFLLWWCFMWFHISGFWFYQLSSNSPFYSLCVTFIIYLYSSFSLSFLVQYFCSVFSCWAILLF